MADTPPQGYVKLPGSVRTPPANARQMGPVDPNERVEVSIYLRDPAASSPADDISEHVQHPGPRMTRAEYNATHSATSDDLTKVEAFARQHQLSVIKTDPVGRRVVLAGTAAAMMTAFATELQRYEYQGGTFRGRTGPLHIPSELAQIVEGVFGLDGRPQAQPGLRYYDPVGSTPKARAGSTPYTPPQLAQLYNFPTGLDGNGQCIALIELGGGYIDQDLNSYFQQLGIPRPQVISVPVDSVQNSPVGDPKSADGEVALDIEVAGGVAPGARIAVYFASNTDRGFLDAITQATHDTTNNPSVISISWGAAEVNWTLQAMQAMDQTFQAAAALGITVCCAAGDNGAAGGVNDGLAHVEFPASDPYALSCGGTRLEAVNNQITEVVWNDGPDSATGGGVSDFFAPPTWQANAGVPPSVNPGHHVGRGVPDVAGNADPQTGYQVYVDGQNVVFGGTSAVAPLWAGLIALMNQQRGQPVGYLNPVLYQNYQRLMQANALRNVTLGNNGAYAAGPGWNACTGAGTPNGAQLLNALNFERAGKEIPSGAEGQELESLDVKTISAWVSERTTSSKEPLRVGETYILNFKVGQPVNASLITGPSARVPPTDVPQEGLEMEWVVYSRTIELGAISREIVITSSFIDDLDPWTARFSLLVPRQGESPTRQLRITPRALENAHLDVLIYARGELYRQFMVELAVTGTQATPQRGNGSVAVVKGETIHTPANQLGLQTPHEWQRPPGKLDIVVLDQKRALVRGDIARENVFEQVDEDADWQGDPPNLAGTIKNMSTAAERFRATAENYLNDIEPTDLAHRLEHFVPQYDWAQLGDMSDVTHKQAWDNVRNSTELRELAIYGYDLYEQFFPAGSKLRSWLDPLRPGHYLDIKWTDNRGIASVPWGLMYLKDPSLPIDPFGFLGLRFRIHYTSHPVQMTPKHLGSLNETYPTYCLYWGNQEQDLTSLEAQWQRNLWTNWANQVLVPDKLASSDPKQALLELLRSPERRPMPVLYFYCQCSLDKGANLPVLRFANTNQPADIVKQVEIPRNEILDHPLVFANACTTSAADPYIANELESIFFRRGCRAYLGTETKVPIQLASRFAAIFFHFFYRKVDPAPMAAGEAVAQTRLFLWTQYKNIGGLLYTYINKYELFMANATEIAAMRW